MSLKKEKVMKMRRLRIVADTMNVTTAKKRMMKSMKRTMIFHML
jgi:hypothetical protein